MDLKGSLIDTQLKICPSEKFGFILRKILKDEKAPENIKKFLIEKATPKDKEKNIECFSNDSDFSLTAQDLSHLEAIKVTVESIELNNGDKPKENINEISNEISFIEKETKIVSSDNFVTLSDICWLYEILKRKRKSDKNIPYIHELLNGAYIETPENATIKRNPVLEARCVKLRAQQEAREYRQMTKSVDNLRMRHPEDTIQYQLKQVNRQLIAIAQFIISIFAGFLFGFKGVEWLIGYLDFGFRLLLGVMCALVIALAEIYFLAKRLNEEMDVCDNSYLGNSPKLTKAQSNQGSGKNSNINKEHKD